MDDSTLRTRLQDLREGHTGDPARGAAAFTEDARWRDQAGQGWLEGRDAIRRHFHEMAESDDEITWDPFEVIVEGNVALVRCRMVQDDASREGWVRLGLGEELLTSWDATWVAL